MSDDATALHPGGRACQGHQRGDAARGRRAGRARRSRCMPRMAPSPGCVPGGRAARLGGHRPGHGRARRGDVPRHATAGRHRRRRLRGEHAARHGRDHRPRPGARARRPPWSAPCRPRNRPRGARSSSRRRAPSSRWSPPTSSRPPSTVRSWPASTPARPDRRARGQAGAVRLQPRRRRTSTSTSTRTSTRGSVCAAASRDSPTPTAATTARSATSSTSSCGARRSSRRSGWCWWTGRLKRSNGKLFGYEGSDFGALSTTPIASRATLLNITDLRLSPRRPDAARGRPGLDAAASSRDSACQLWPGAVPCSLTLLHYGDAGNCPIRQTGPSGEAPLRAATGRTKGAGTAAFSARERRGSPPPAQRKGGLGGGAS